MTDGRQRGMAGTWKASANRGFFYGVPKCASCVCVFARARVRVPACVCAGARARVRAVGVGAVGVHARTRACGWSVSVYVCERTLFQRVYSTRAATLSRASEQHCLEQRCRMERGLLAREQNAVKVCTVLVPDAWPPAFSVALGSAQHRSCHVHLTPIVAEALCIPLHRAKPQHPHVQAPGDLFYFLRMSSPSLPYFFPHACSGALAGSLRNIP